MNDTLNSISKTDNGTYLEKYRNILDT